MASQQQLKRRIGSVKNTRQITKAMELVSASKMRKAQEGAMKGREYAALSQQILSRLRELTDVSKHPLFDVRETPKARLHIVVTSDRGLAGAYNANVLKQFASEVRADRDDGLTSYVITIGRQGGAFAGKVQHVQSLAAYTDFPEHPTANDLRPILDTVISAFIKGAKRPEEDQDKEVDFGSFYGQKEKESEIPEPVPASEEALTELRVPGVDFVDIIYTDYKSSILQEVKSTRLLPAAFTDVVIEADLEQATFEPSTGAVLESVTQRLVEVQLYQALLESMASEQSARMMAMKNASDNANDIIGDLTLAFNTARQAAITQELAEITGGAEAIK